MEVECLARAFRAAIEAAPLRWVSFTDFPKGACGDTSLILGQFLHDSGSGTWTYQSGRLAGQGVVTHAWIERDGWLLDLTADQFDGIDEPVILTTERTWHDRFQPVAGDRRAALLARGDQLWSTYREVVARLAEP